MEAANAGNDICKERELLIRVQNLAPPNYVYFNDVYCQRTQCCRFHVHLFLSGIPDATKLRRRTSWKFDVCHTCGQRVMLFPTAGEREEGRVNDRPTEEGDEEGGEPQRPQPSTSRQK